MTQDKDLLLKYLCMALPYRTAIRDDYGDTIFLDYNDVHIQNYFERIVEGVVRPYLRPMSSMTEKDCLSLSKELNLSIRARGGDIYFPHNEDNTLENWNKVNNWLLKNHFDSMGLIPKKLAIEVTEENNPYEN